MLLSSKKLCALALLGSISLSGCMSTTSIGAGSDRKQLVFMSQEHIVKKANNSFDKSALIEKDEYYQDEARLVSIINTLIPYADEYLAEDHKVKWAIHLWRTEKVNAGALANGIITVTPKLALNKDITDDELAYIIAHEMAHVVRQHHRELASWKYLIKPTMLATAIVTSGATATISGVGHDIYGTSYNKTIENEADLLGLEIYAKAGYNPENVFTLFDKVEPLFKKNHPIASRMPALISNHSSFKQREKVVRENLNRVKSLQEAHVKKESDNLITWDFKNNFIESKIADRIKESKFNKTRRYKSGIIVMPNNRTPKVETVKLKNSDSDKLANSDQNMLTKDDPLR